MPHARLSQAAFRLSGLGLIALAAMILALALAPTLAGAQSAAAMPFDPGVRGGPAGAGAAVAGASSAERAFFSAGRDAFLEIDSVQGEDVIPETDGGLGPRFNLDSCAGCHAQPAVGGTSPLRNPQVAAATREGAQNKIPFFVTLDGPVREARFKRNPDGSPDGGVHDLFTITGRRDAPGCSLPQPDFETAAAQNNLSFRIPTPTFGNGLIEAISDRELMRNKNANSSRKGPLDIAGHENREGNAGTITRFGWKAQNKSLLLFSAEAYLVEQGVSNDIFGNERDEVAGCLFNAVPEDESETVPETEFSDPVLFAAFMRFLAPPTPVTTTSSERGKDKFDDVGCTMCHTPSLTTGNSSSAALRRKTVPLYSDLLVHNMGVGLADGVSQGSANGREFRTAPLWGLGKRIFFLHDGRTRDLVEAIGEHYSFGSEANKVVLGFNALAASEKQDVLNFLRSL